jgi:two-component system, OmpR family, sensor kinase
VPIRLKLALQFSAVTLVLLLGVGILFGIELRRDLQHSMDNVLRSRADELVAQVGAGSGGVGPLRLPGGSYGQLLTTDGRLLQSTDDAPPQPLLTPEQAGIAVSGQRFYDGAVQLLSAAQPDSAASRPKQQSVRILSEPAGPGRVVVVAASREDREEATARAAEQLLVIGVIVLLVAGPGAWLLARAALRPVEQMRGQAAELQARDAGAGLSVPGSRDELSRLAQTLNGLLGRLHEAYERECAFVADAGHELRTPLTVLRGELELARRPGRSNQQLAATVEVAAEQTERLIRLAEDLLVLARDENEPARFVRFDLGEVADAAGAAAGIAVPDRPVRITVDAPEEPVVVSGDPDRIRRAVDNLVLNALRFAPDGSEIRIEVAECGGHAELAVADQGPGFAPEFLPIAFERFSRHDQARTRSEQDCGEKAGTGLGLAIVRSVMRAHSGSATAANLTGSSGARVTLRWPTGTGSQ